MTDDRQHRHFAAESLASIRALPCHAVLRSTNGVWTSVLLEYREMSVSVGETVYREPLLTPDQTLVMTVSGDSELESLRGGIWRRTIRQAGSAGLTPGGHADRIRVRLRVAQPLRTAHLYIPADFVSEAAEHFRRAGTAAGAGQLSSLGFVDPTVSQTVMSLLRAAHYGVPDIYAESAAQFLAVHLLSRNAGWYDAAGERRSIGPLGDRRLARALEYLSTNFREHVTLDSLAAEAGISKFHFVRLFRTATGEAPHTLLIRLRLHHARRLLRNTDLSVGEISRACGYSTAAHFARAFGREVGTTPTVFREHARSGKNGLEKAVAHDTLPSD